ncbi:hypothetical protein WJX72_004238 [[Myrmecia] bisecta]|uniref:Uncharacterized protein n=1 Tax=[Myrmecia] bisecta TaxID=41462 RepID=A0AAW1R5T6_9CHLO
MGLFRVAVVMIFSVASCTCQLQATSPSCNVPTQARNLSAPLCPSQAATEDDARALAWRFAPRLYFHPVEQYHLEDPSFYFSQAAFYGAIGTTNDPVVAVQEAIASVYPYLLLPKSYITVIGTPNETALLAGAPYDGQGRSTAKVFYNIVDTGTGAWVFNYNLYYSYNGCGNIDLSLAFHGEYSAVDGYVCPIGIHEGDWERVSVTVCKGSSTPSQVSYSQHGWQQVLDCTAGECPFDENGHPVSYVALNSHANYPISSPLNLYSLKRLNFLANLDGIYIGDRTLVNPNLTFVPTPDNIVELPDIENITADNAAQDGWAFYTGNWGKIPLPPQETTITCLNDNQTAAGPCQEGSLAYEMLAAAMQVYTGAQARNLSKLVNVTLPLGASKVIADTVNTTYEPASLTGPWLRDWSHRRLPDTASAPIWSERPPVNVTQLGPQVCPRSGDPRATARTKVEYDSQSIAGYLLGLGIAICAFSGALAVFLIVPNCCGWNSYIRLVPAPEADQSAMHSRKPTRESLLLPLGNNGGLLFRVLWGISGLALYITGAVLVGIGMSTLFSLLNQIYNWSTWGSLRKLIIAVLTIIGFFDLLAAAIYIFVTTEPYVVLIGNRRRYRNPATRVRWLARNSRLVHMVLFAFIALVVCLCMLVFALGLLASVVKMVFLNTCERVATVATNTGICLNLQDNGLDLSVCGDRIVDVCNRWNADDVNNIAIGACFVVWAHLLFAAMSLATFPLTCTYRADLSSADMRRHNGEHEFVDNPLATELAPPKLDLEMHDNGRETFDKGGALA